MCACVYIYIYIYIYIYMSYDEKCLQNVFVSISNLVVLNSITYINVYCYDSNYSSSDILLQCVIHELLMLYICVSVHVLSLVSDSP